MRQAQSEIAQRLLAEKPFQFRFHHDLFQWIGSEHHAVISADAQKLGREGTDTAFKPLPTENERINLWIFADGFTDGNMGFRVRVVQEDQKVDVGNALNS